jgi:hypothetical protein
MPLLIAVYHVVSVLFEHVAEFTNLESRRVPSSCPVAVRGSYFHVKKRWLAAGILQLSFNAVLREE